MGGKVDVCVLISAGAEWRALLPHFSQAELESTPFGDCFVTSIDEQRVSFLHGGWGKVAAAASAQYAIDRWQPDRIINLGTCGGFSGQVTRSAVILVEKTIIYDIIEQMTDFDQAIEHYSVEFDLSWLPDTPPQPVIRGTLVSADRDILPEDIPELIRKYNAAVADWESGAIAWVAYKNGLPCLILRGVSDLVDAAAGEAYGNYAFFEEQCQSIMADFAQALPAWLEAFKKSKE
jgi:adenosylhomocysteine nucleosidase